MANKITARMKNILKYFNKDGDTYHIKTGYVCIMEGFTEDYISMIFESDNGDELRAYSMASDNKYQLNDDAINLMNVYELKRLT